MSLFSNPRSRRRIAFVVLFGWLFALSAAWANACVLEARGTHLDVSEVVVEGVAFQTALVSAGHAGVAPAHAGDAGHAKSTCLKFCGDGSQTIVKAKPAYDQPGGAMAPPLTLVLIPRTAAIESGGSRHALAPPFPGLPLRTRYSRLTL